MPKVTYQLIYLDGRLLGEPSVINLDYHTSIAQLLVEIKSERIELMLCYASELRVYKNVVALRYGYPLSFKKMVGQVDSELFIIVVPFCQADTIDFNIF